MKIKLGLQITFAASLFGVALSDTAFAAVTTVSTDRVTMQVGLMDAEPPQAPGRNNYSQGMMEWEEGTLHPYTAGYWRPDPSDVIPQQDMWRIWDIVFSGNTNFNIWNCAPNPGGSLSNELGTMLQAPLVIGTVSNATVFYPSNITYQWYSGDGPNDAFGSVKGTLSVLQGTTNIQSWSSTCVGIFVTNGVPTVYESGLMTNPVTQIYYSGVYAGFLANDASSMLSASNYAEAYWPFDISATYVLTDSNGNTLCQATASLDSQFHWHAGNTTTNTSAVETSPGYPIALSTEAWNDRQYRITTFSNGFLPNSVSNEVFFATMGDNGMITNATNCQFFKAANGSVKSDVFIRPGAPQVFSNNK